MTQATVEVTACICTFRRPALRIAIDSLARQVLPAEASLRILVVDNDFEPTARPVVDDMRSAANVPIAYRHAPAQNISIARNAGLDAVETPWLAFIDDDERAAPDWLAILLAERIGAQAIFGPCEAVYPDGAPSWMRRGDFHSNRIDERRGPINTGYTSNVLIDMNFVRRRGLRFDLKLGRSGGEDSLFFHAMHRLGGVLKYAPRAIVYEDVAASRIGVGWIVKRRYRAGQTYALMLRRLSPSDYWRSASSSPVKIATCALMSALTAFDAGRAAWWIMRGAFHVGVLSSALGMRVHQEYRTPSNSAS
jgi:succinoglycan biosynthesis protein ExoM